MIPNHPHPTEFQMVIDRIDALETQMSILRMQVSAALNGLELASRTLTALSSVTESQTSSIDSLRSLWRMEMMKAAVERIIEHDTNDPAPEDVWEYDEWREGRELTYRVEQPAWATQPRFPDDPELDLL